MDIRFFFSPAAGSKTEKKNSPDWKELEPEEIDPMEEDSNPILNLDYYSVNPANGSLQSFLLP